MEEAEKSSFVEIKPSGFPKMREKKKFEKGGTQGWKMAGEGKWPTAQANKKIEFFFKFFLFGDVHSPHFFSS